MITAIGLAIAGIVTSVAATAAGVYSSVQQANAQEGAAKYNAAVERNNAQIATQNSQFEAERIRKRNVIMRGKQRVAFAKSGVDISGTVDDVMYDSEIEGNLDLLATKYAGAIATRDRQARAGLFAAQGDQARTTGLINAGSSILAGAGQFSSNYGNYLKIRDNPTL
jgi:hypothetical protein